MHKMIHVHVHVFTCTLYTCVHTSKNAPKCVLEYMEKAMYMYTYIYIHSFQVQVHVHVHCTVLVQSIHVCKFYVHVHQQVHIQIYIVRVHVHVHCICTCMYMYMYTPLLSLLLPLHLLLLPCFFHIMKPQTSSPRLVAPGIPMSQQGGAAHGTSHPLPPVGTVELAPRGGACIHVCTCTYCKFV